MFTGVIQKKGKVRELDAKAGKLSVETSFADLELGESIAVDGVCLTVAETQGNNALFSVSPETFQRTKLESLQSGSPVNLERALTLSTRLSGHLVQGHVDGIGKIRSLSEVENCNHLLKIEIPNSLSRYCVEKGSISIDGISLTINNRKIFYPENFSELELMIVPHTWNETNLSDARAGDAVNIEVDILAKYVENFSRAASSQDRKFS